MTEATTEDFEMDKATRVIRRSGVKLLSLGVGHSDLNVLVSDIKDIKSCARAFMNAQQIAAQDMTRWAVHQENRAIQDVITNIADLFALWTDVQKTFINSLKEYRLMYERILEGEKQVCQAKENLEYFQEKELKIKKDMNKVSKRASPSELRILQSKVEQAESGRELAEHEVRERVRENEAVKLIRLKEGLLKMSGSYLELITQGNTIFTAQRHVAIQLPDVHGQDPETQYTGIGTTRYITEKAKLRVQSFTMNDISSDPPPPYTPPESVDSQGQIPRLSQSRISSDFEFTTHSESLQQHTLASDFSNATQTACVENKTTRHSVPECLPFSHSSAQHRHSVPSDQICSAGSEGGWKHRPRSRSDNDMSWYSRVPNSSGILSRSDHSVPENSASNVGHTRSNCSNNSLTDNLQTCSLTERTSETTGLREENPNTLVVKNVTKFLVVDSLPNIAVKNADSRPEGDFRGYGQREASEHSSYASHLEDNLKFADEKSYEEQVSDARPLPAPRQTRLYPEVQDNYETAEED